MMRWDFSSKEDPLQLAGGCQCIHPTVEWWVWLV